MACVPYSYSHRLASQSLLHGRPPLAPPSTRKEFNMISTLTKVLRTDLDRQLSAIKYYILKITDSTLEDMRTWTDTINTCDMIQDHAATAMQIARLLRDGNAKDTTEP